MTFTLLLLLLGPAAPAQAAEARTLEARAQEPRRCAIRLIEIPVDPGIDPKMILRVPPGPPPDHMPLYRGLPPCPPRE
jgi:hypothetical protein